MHSQSPSTTILQLHLPGQQNIFFKETERLETTYKETTLTAWFSLNEKEPEARKYLYQETPRHYQFNTKTKEWLARKNLNKHAVGRIYFAQPSDTERYSLRMLLTKVRGATSYENIKMIEGVQYKTFKGRIKLDQTLN